MSEKTAVGSIIRFGGFDLDVKAGELRRQGRTVRLQDKPLQLLMLLLGRPTSELVTREEIQEHIWGTSRFIDFEDSLNQAVRKLREALRDSASDPRFLETIPRRGYRFLMPVDGRPQSGSSPMAGQPVKPLPIGARGITIGRRCELSKLNTVLQMAKESGGRMFCIAGEPGIGKTTLVETFLAGLDPGFNCHIARGRCSERLCGIEAYLPILEGLDSIMRGPHAEIVREILVEVAPSWYVQMADCRSASVARDAAAASQERKKREFVSFLELVTREQPLIFFIDDMHWADVSTIDLLSYVIPHSQVLPVLLLTTYRPSDMMLASHPFCEAKLELQSRRLCTELELGSLGREDIEKYIDVEFPGNKFPEEFVAAVVRRTEGSPLFLADLLRDLRAASLISNQEGCWRLANSLAEIESTSPDSVRGMIARKIDRLDENHRRLLGSASVQGLEFNSAVLAAVMDSDVTDIEDSLRFLEEKHRIIRFMGEREFPDSTLSLRYAFSHALYQESLYAGIRPTRRAVLSGATAHVLLQRYGQKPDEIAAQVAQLFEAAREWDEASKWFCVAAARAAGLSAYREASELSLRAVETSKKLSGAMREERLLDAAAQLASARQALSEFEQSILDFTMAAEAAAGLGNTEAQIDALCGAAFAAGMLKRTAEMRERALHALAVAEAAGSSTAKAEGILGYERLLMGDLAVARSHLDRARPALLQDGALSQAAFVTGSAAFLYGLQSEYAQADTLFAEAMGERMHFANPADLLRITWMRGIALANQGRISDALQMLKDGVRTGEINGECYWLSRIPNTVGWIYSELLDPETALKHNLDGIVAGQQAGTPEVEANSHINAANAYTALGDLNPAWRHLSESQQILNVGGEWLMKWRFSIRLELENANYWLAKRELVRARASAKLALAKVESVLARKHAAWAHKLLADIDLLEEIPESAATECATALEIIRHYPCPLIEWKVLLAASQAASLCGDSDHAEACIESGNGNSRGCGRFRS